ncbi:Holliday junction resolvase RuvX [Candidatus Daviesbacteria bacterium]|nr:Holliday junction resolvase RuvX [Candidatus Daviesbacteria bacterium]
MRYLGIDFGLRRIGLAVSEGNIASPWQVLKVRNFSDAIEKTTQLIKEGNFQKIIIGLPEGKIGKYINGFVNALKKRGFDVTSADETLSSKRALDQLIKLNTPKLKRHINDDTAAAIILQDYLDSLPSQ